MKLVLSKKNEETEKLLYKIEMIEQDKGMRSPQEENYKRPIEVLKDLGDNSYLRPQSKG